MADREKIEKGLRICTSKEPCNGCPYLNERNCSLSMVADTLALLEEQPQIVRCKDCKYWSAERINDFNKCRRWINVGVKNFATMGEWFCGDGERRCNMNENA